MNGLYVLLSLLVLTVTIYKIFELKHNAKHREKDSDEFRHFLEQELSDRDDKANALEERVRVLEKILTENYKSDTLAKEIDQLKEQANE